MVIAWGRDGRGWESRIGGYGTTLIGIENQPIARLGQQPVDRCSRRRNSVPTSVAETGAGNQCCVWASPSSPRESLRFRWFAGISAKLAASTAQRLAGLLRTSTARSSSSSCRATVGLCGLLQGTEPRPGSDTLEGTTHRLSVVHQPPLSSLRVKYASSQKIWEVPPITRWGHCKVGSPIR